MLLDRVVDRLGGLSGRSSGRPVSDLPKTPRMGPGPAGTQNRHFLNRTSIEKCHDSDGRRIRGFWSSRPRPDSLLFRALGGTHFRVRFLHVFASRISFCLRRLDREFLNRPVVLSWRVLALVRRRRALDDTLERSWRCAAASLSPDGFVPVVGTVG